MRIVSLLPSATEIVYALGLEPVGVSQACDFPASVTSKPTIVRSRVDGDTSSEEINEQVTDAERGGGVYELDLTQLERVAPDLIISQEICDVCAVDAALVTDAVSELGLECDILRTDPHSLGDMIEDIQRIGSAAGKEDQAEKVIGDLEKRVEAVTKTAGNNGRRPRVAVFDWMEPVMIAGHWMPELVELAGGDYGMAEPESKALPREWTEILEYDPEVIVVAPCGFELEQTEAHLNELTSRDGWDALSAVQSDSVYLLDGHNYANRPGPRLVDTLEFLAWIVHPDKWDAPPETAVQQFKPK